MEFVPLLSKQRENPLLSECENQNTADCTYNFNKWTYLIFFALGMGPTFNVTNAINLELAYFERTQPEGLALSAWLGLAQTISAGISIAVALFFGGNVPGAKIAFFLIPGNFFLNVLVAFFWHKTIGGFSVFLLVGTLGGTTIGNLYYAILVPWVASAFPPACTSAFISGESFMALLSVLLQLIQNPGYHPRFSPNLYLILLAVPIIFSFCSLVYIQHFIKVKNSFQLVEGNRESLCPRWFTDQGLYFFVQCMWGAGLAWWILLIILPFACAATDRQEHLGTGVLQWATCLGYTAILPGNILTGFLGRDANFHILPVLLAMTFLELLIFLVAFDLPGNGFWSNAKVFLVADAMLIRLGFGYVTPLIYRDMARKMPNASEKVARLANIWELFASIIVYIIMFTLTVKVFKA